MPKPPEELRKALSLYCKGKARAYRVDTTKGTLDVRLFHKDKGFVRRDFSLKGYKRIVSDFLAKHPENKGVFWLLYSGQHAYSLTTHDFKRVANAGFVEKKPILRVKEEFQNRRFGTLFFKLALDHYEQAKGVRIKDAAASSDYSFRMAENVGFTDYEKDLKAKRVVYH